MVTSTFAAFIATVVTIPALGWYLIYISTVKLTRQKRKAIKWASDFSAVLFMAAVYFIMEQLWEPTSVWLVLALFFSVAITFTIIYWNVMEDFYATKLLKGIWRLNFLIFVSIYILLSGYGLIRSIFSFV
ncbi:DUF3397 domain-containing protein [Alkalicoccobacillus gibsonii]|jgi:hypothetical protein|uniref:DUF3397 domain-containing protein n=1 Tax=Alkalicoccobacillus gibsonii TaxID=79881 RepID=A0ABU9VM49_9BACI|nr:DUF3397 domain-containing protein [Alkalicoccobacillus gibsonii]MBM0065266.1 DUF3397 domain-containing protein [Alkalicoccobacillus gibsonii]